jgi:hypothetical protein
MARLSHCFVAGLLLVGLGVAPAAHGSPLPADPTAAVAPISALTITDTDFSGASSELHVNFYKPISKQRADVLLTNLSGNTSHVSSPGGVLRATTRGTLTVRDATNPSAEQGQNATHSAVAPDGAGPQGQSLDCDQYYGFSDHDGTFHIQRACASSSAPWGYQISPAVQAMIVGTVSEAGLEWAKNGATQPKMAPHPAVIKNYIFHGTFSGSPANTHIAYTDYISFRHSGGTGYIQFYGSFIVTGNRPCQPGGPC